MSTSDTELLRDHPGLRVDVLAVVPMGLLPLFLAWAFDWTGGTVAIVSSAVWLALFVGVTVIALRRQRHEREVRVERDRWSERLRARTAARPSVKGAGAGR